MKRKNPGVSKRTIALAAAALLLFGAGSITGTRAELQFFGENYNAEFELDHLNVSLVEVGNDGTTKTFERGEDPDASGVLIEWMGGIFEPGRTYKEEISAKNNTDNEEIVRLSIRKCWLDADGNKTTEMDPDLIQLSYKGDASGYNSGEWQINDSETTAERTTYYLRYILGGNASTEPVVNQLRVSGEILDDVEISGPDANGVYTYTYKYDGYRIRIEADVQALQTHNANDAIRSLWGVRNVTVSGNTVSVAN